MLRLSVSILALALACAVPCAAFAAQVTVGNAWFRALPGGVPAGGYFVLRNEGKSPITLTGASSPACGSIMLHKSTHMGGMDRMEMVEAVAVSPKGHVSFAPGGYHLMCMDPGTAMTPGQFVAVTLKFADGTRLAARFAVKNAMGK